jgi:hypothetical protein
MRDGTNPGKLDPDLEPFGRHRVVIVISTDAAARFTPTRSSIESICQGAGDAAVSVIAMARTPSVDAAIEAWMHADAIDQAIFNEDGWDESDALLAAAQGSFEAFVTVVHPGTRWSSSWMTVIDRTLDARSDAGVVTWGAAPAVAITIRRDVLEHARRRGVVVRDGALATALARAAADAGATQLTVTAEFAGQPAAAGAGSLND